MSGAIDKKLLEIREELDSSPTTHLSARTGILDAVTLSREFSNTRLNALCEKLTSVTFSLYIQLEDQGTGNNLLQDDTTTGNDNVSTLGNILMEPSILDASYSLAQVCESLAKQRAICYGAKTISHTFKKFDFPSYETVNGALLLTEPNTSFMGIKSTDISETFTINLTTLAGTQTQGSNTFSTDVRDYYLVRSRVTGELIDINDSIIPYSTPDGDTAFGNAIAWGGDVTTEAGTWNADFAKANIASVALQSEGLYNELNTLTLQDHLTQGSNTSYTTLGAAFGQKFYLKRHTDYVNTFTIIGTTTVDSIEVTGISDSDLAKIKYGDVISGTGIPDDNVTIAGVKTADSKIRLSNTGIATVDGTVTLTVNSVPFGYQENDIFCQLEIVGEGLVINPDWKPVGDDVGDYSGTDAGADDLLNANTSQFIGLLSFFDPNNGSANATNDLTKSARGDWVSEGKEYNGTSYPYIERSPFFPAIGSTHKAYEVDNGEIVGTQPTGLGEDDIPAGRYVRWDVKRADETGALPENRYYTDSAEKFYYEIPCTSQYTCGTVTVGTTHPMPNVGEPPTALAKTGLTDTITRVQGASVTANGVVCSVGNTTDVPADDNTTLPSTSGSSSPPTAGATIANYYTLGSDNLVYVNRIYYASVTITSGTNWTAAIATATTTFPCKYNFAQKHIYEASMSVNTDVQFINDSVGDLTDTISFRDPVIDVDTAQAGGSGISDNAFDTYVTADELRATDLPALQSALATFRGLTALTSRTGAGNGGSGLGSLVTFANTTWAAYHTEAGTLSTNCGKRVTEIDTRIGVPTRSGSQSTVRGTAPAIYVSAIPTANTTGGLVPYGRALYNSCNNLLGKDLKMMTQLIQDIQSLDSLVDLVKKARNKYEIFNGRDKEYS